ncbi:MAG: hypothetical protein JXB33_02340 [Clostridia bacterium]|nr:hypothetical protein [Clostridia bacterium]
MKLVSMRSRHALFEFDASTGFVSGISLPVNGKIKNLLTGDISVCDITGLVAYDCKITGQDDNILELSVAHETECFRVESRYSLHKKGYIVCSINIEALKDTKPNQDMLFGLKLSKDMVFKHSYRIRNDANDMTFRRNRAFSVDFSIDGRPVSHCIDFMIENTKGGEKVHIESDDGVFLGWRIDGRELSGKGNIYKNKWCVSISGITGLPSPVRGQRIYHWYGMYPRYPSCDMLDEMAEYGCSVLILHMPVFRYIDGSVPYDEKKFVQTIEKAHSLQMKVLFYCQPLLISKASGKYDELRHCINSDGHSRWNSMKDTQVIFYGQNTDYDCDELCLRCSEAYDYVKARILECHYRYGFDGLYVDFAWPGQGICGDISHGHEPGLFNFHDYLRIIRELRNEIGDGSLMIGHGGSIMTGSDFIEGFDGCLTGEGQGDIRPDVIGVQYGCAPMLWTMHRRKERTFRSKEAMSGLIREGITPHIGLGIMGKSIMASMDPGHTPHFIALWQMWRAFPVEKAIFCNYLTERAFMIDNEEIHGCMYSVPGDGVLLIMSNGGGPTAEKAFAVSVSIRIDIDKLGLDEKLRCWSLKGNDYETFRIEEEADVLDGLLYVPEIGIDEFMGFILAKNQPPEEMKRLQEHLEGRFDRMAKINEEKMKRLIEADNMLREFNRMESGTPDEEAFMKDRVAE